ncbi:hypothetical protein [Magnetospirillum sp. XM-1]|uniref:hypothetical protein n=1 Tax=Magnetospirillum sp. XM-1 TaxID=1663591 RepID=UPI000838FC3E|nr:hypothetical protein [Magnetospirillum sp. XM-1]
MKQQEILLAELRRWASWYETAFLDFDVPGPIESTKALLQSEECSPAYSQDVLPQGNVTRVNFGRRR